MSGFVLRHHGLQHIPNLRVDPEVLRARFSRDCSMARCAARCCATGVWIDAAEHQRLLRHASLIQAHMDESQEKSPDRWFDAAPRADPDFPSGLAFGTAVASGACVFLGEDKRCVLQKASNAETGHLKPVFCVAFPVALVEGVLCLDEPKDSACCTPDPQGSLTIFDLCANELEYFLGADGVKALRDQGARVDEHARPQRAEGPSEP